MCEMICAKSVYFTSAPPQVKTQYLHSPPMTKGSMGQCYGGGADLEEISEKNKTNKHGN